jgi:hypothetical protein
LPEDKAGPKRDFQFLGLSHIFGSQDCESIPDLSDRNQAKTNWPRTEKKIEWQEEDKFVLVEGNPKGTSSKHAWRRCPSLEHVPWLTGKTLVDLVIGK